MSLRHFFAIVELRTKVVGVSSYAVGTLYALARGIEFHLLPAVLLFFGVVFVDMGTTAFNSFFDYARGVDNRLFNRESDKVLVHSGVAPAHAFLVSIALFAAAAVLGVVLAVITTPLVLVVGAVSLGVGFAYNGGPLPISRTPVGELFAGAFLGSVVVLLAYGIHQGGIDGPALAASVPSTFFIASILTTNNTCDIQGDRHAGRKTLSVLIGRRAGEAVLVGLGISAFALVGLLAAVGILPPTAWAVPALGIPASLPLYGAMHRRGYSHETKGPSMRGILRVFLLFSFLYCLSLGAAAILDL